MPVDGPPKLGEYDAILTIRIKTTDLWVPLSTMSKLLSFWVFFYLLQLTKTTPAPKFSLFAITKDQHVSLAALNLETFSQEVTQCLRFRISKSDVADVASSIATTNPTQSIHDTYLVP